MKKIFCLVVSFYFTFCSLHYLYAEPIPRNADTERIYQKLEKIAQLTDRITLWEDIIKSSSVTRLDLAVFLNQCLLLSEEKNIKIPDEIVSPLLAEFDRELLLLDIQSKIDKQNIYLNKIMQSNMKVLWQLQFSFAGEQLAGDFPTTERELTLYGAPPPSSVISLSQQMRLLLFTETKNTRFSVGLRNFGFWGIGKYTSGATGINFASSDPPSIEEIVFQTSNDSIVLNIGRRYLRLGKYGLLVDYLITPLESIQLFCKYKKVSADILIGSRYDSPDYYGGRLGIGQFGIIGFSSAIRESYRTKYGLINDKGLGADFSINLGGGRQLVGEYAYYIPNGNDGFHSWVAGIDLLSSKKLNLMILYGNLDDIPQQAIPINRLPLEFIDRKFLRLQSNSYGPNLFFSYKLPYQIDANYEFLYLDRKTENDILKRHTVRFLRQIWKEGAYFILEDFYTIEGDSKYNTVRGQIVFNF